jgi:NTE family protein/lysophospholipid hydrolase
VGEVLPGETVGEMAVLTNEMRSGTVRAIRDSELVVFSKHVFDNMLETYPLAMMQITRQIVRRLQRRNSCDVLKSVLTIAVVPAGPEPTFSLFAHRLAEALGQLQPTLHLTSERISRYVDGDRAQTSDAPRYNKILSWLNEQEAKYQYVVYESDHLFTEWTRRCLSQADHVLAVGMSGSDTSLGQVEEAIQRYDSLKAVACVDLVLLHKNGRHLPVGTHDWIGSRRVNGQYHIRLDSRLDCERLARLLTGQATGLVLGGGGARGLSHIGALRAVEESGIPIDVIGGTSMGAIISALYALGLDHQSMVEACRKFFVDQNALLDLTLPFVSITTGARISRELERCFGGIRIEDLWLPYFCVSSNLTRAKVMVHREGPIWRCLRASISLPGILPPVFHDGDLLVDGGLLNNLPVDVMRSIYPVERVLAADVRLKVDLVQEEPFREELSGWQILAHRINPFGKRIAVPSVQSILMRASMLSSSGRDDLISQAADLCLRPPLENFHLLDFKPIEQLVDVGYTYSLQRLEEWSSSNNRAPEYHA